MVGDRLDDLALDPGAVLQRNYGDACTTVQVRERLVRHVAVHPYRLPREGQDLRRGIRAHEVQEHVWNPFAKRGQNGLDEPDGRIDVRRMVETTDEKQRVGLYRRVVRQRSELHGVERHAVKLCRRQL